MNQLLLYQFVFALLFSHLIILNALKFYIIELPRDVESSFPAPGAKLTKRHRGHGIDLTHDMLLNHGAGMEVDAANGVYASSHLFTRYTIMMARLRVDPRRTMNQAEADLTIIPYDIDTSSYFNKHTGHYRNAQMGGCKEEGPIVVEALNKSIAATGVGGHDHILISEMGMGFWVECLDVIKACYNCTKVVSMAEVHTLPHSSRRWYGVPFISAVHWNEHLERIPWQAKLNPNILQSKRIEELIGNIKPQLNFSVSNSLAYNFSSGKLIPRNGVVRPDEMRRREIGEIFLDPTARREILGDIPYLVSAWFSIATQAKSSTRIRAELMRDCKARPLLCKEVAIHARQAPQCFAQGQATLSGAVNCDKAESGFQAYNRSIFCFQPPGDGVARKGYFDSIAVGCIPVIFAHMYGLKGWQWYFDPDSDHRLSIYVHKDYLVRNMLDNIVDLLASIPLEEVLSRQAEVEKITPTLLYSIPPKKYDSYIGSGGSRGTHDEALGADGFTPPYRDATDIMLEESYKYIQSYKETGEIPLRDRKHTMNDGYTFWYGEDQIW
jgi:hypothetical protein